MKASVRGWWESLAIDWHFSRVRPGVSFGYRDTSLAWGSRPTSRIVTTYLRLLVLVVVLLNAPDNLLLLHIWNSWHLPLILLMLGSLLMREPSKWYLPCLRDDSLSCKRASVLDGLILMLQYALVLLDLTPAFALSIWLWPTTLSRRGIAIFLEFGIIHGWSHWSLSLLLYTAILLLLEALASHLLAKRAAWLALAWVLQFIDRHFS